MRTAGSMSAERTAKPMKNCVMIKTRNALQKEKGLVMLRACLNMRLLNWVKELIGTAADSDSDRDTESEDEGQ